MKHSLFLTLSLCAVSLVPAATIYDNSQVDTGNSVPYTANAFSQIGDQVTLGGTERYLNSASVQFYNNALTAGTFTAILRFWNVGSPVGSQLGSDYTLNNILINATDILTVSFANLNLDITGTNDVIFTVEVANTGNLDLMLNLYEGSTPGTVGPGPGSSDNSFFIARNAGGFLQGLPSPVDQGNLFFQLEASVSAVPEPSSLALLSGAVLASLWKLRRKSA